MRRTMQCDCRSQLGRLLLAALLVAALLQTASAASSPEELLAAGRADEALQTLELQVSHSSTNAASFNLLCRAYFMIDEWDRGIPSCERATRLDPQKSLYYLWLVRIYGEKADHVGFLSAAGLAKKVRSEFERAVELSPDSWEARTDLAEFYLEAPEVVGGGKDKARDEANRLAPLDAGMAHFIKGRLAEKNKDTDAAEQQFHLAIQATRGGARAYLNLAGFYHHMNRLTEMDQALRKLESSPLDHPGALVDGAGILLRSGRDYPMAVRLLRRYFSSPVEEAPAFKAHVMLGEVLEKQGDRNAAAEEYRTALALAHTYRPAQ